MGAISLSVYRYTEKIQEWNVLLTEQWENEIEHRAPDDIVNADAAVHALFLKTGNKKAAIAYVSDMMATAVPYTVQHRASVARNIQTMVVGGSKDSLAALLADYKT